MFRRYFKYRAPDEDGGEGGGGGGEGDAAAAAAATAAAAAAEAAKASAGAGAGAGGDDKSKAGGDKGLLGKHIADKDKKGGDGKGGEGEGDDKAGEDGRPAHVPKQFWNAKDKAVDYAAWAKSTNDTRQALKTAGGKGAKVASAAEYKYLAPEGIPEHISTAADDPTVKALHEIAFKAGLTQEQFKILTDDYFAHAAKLMPAPDLEAEKAALGENGQAVLEAVENWGRGLVESGVWSPEEFDEIVALGSTARGLKALNKVREQLGGQIIPLNPGDTPEGGGWSLEECYEKAGEDKYYTDASYRAKVDKRIEQLVGTAPAGSSPHGMGVKAAAPSRKVA